MTFLPGLEVVLVSSTAGVVEGPTLVRVLLKAPPGELLSAGARLDVLAAHFVGLQDLFLVTAGVLTSLLAHEPDTRPGLTLNMTHAAGLSPVLISLTASVGES